MVARNGDLRSNLLHTQNLLNEAQKVGASARTTPSDVY